ncbi:MAG: protein kinase [Deltaproteobacteria bacterium]|nr:protein kinase [Deltaproteobacteria bacterium]
MSIAEFLTTVPGFETLNSSTLQAVTAEMTLKEVEEGEYLIRRGDPGESMYIIKQGDFRVPVFDDTGRVRVVAQLGPCDVVGEMALLTGERRRADVIADTPAVVVAIDRGTMAPLLSENPPFARFLTEILGKRLEEAGGVERVGKYRLLGKLGEGATAKVYEALHPGLNRTVAVKMLGHHLVYDKAFKERFLEEARTIAGLAHPNIVQVFDTEQAYATLFLVMEKVEGTDLRHVLDEEGSLPPEEVADILRQLAQALAFAHERGIVHRDVKPANAAIDEDGSVKLMDFGIARRYSRDEGSNIVEGTPRYLAPEAIVGRPVDGRADIYSLGIMAWEMLVGRPPFMAPDIEALLERHLTDPPPDIRKLRPGTPDGLAAFVKGALEKEPENRLSDWGKIDAMLRGGDAAEAALETFDETLIRVRFKPRDRAKVNRAIDAMRGQLVGVPWTDVATAELVVNDLELPEPTSRPRKSWRERLGLGAKVSGDDIETRIPE